MNGPAQVVFSGPPGALEELLGWCAAEGVWAQRVPVDYAAHSAQVEAIRGPLLTGLDEIAPRAGEVPFYSAVTGGPADTAGLNEEYWFRNLREQVRFADTIGALATDGHRVFVEVSPHPVLAGAINDTLTAAGSAPGRAGPAAAAGGLVAVTGTLRRRRGGARQMLLSAANVFVHGVSVDWAGLLAAGGGRRVDVPTQAFVRQRFWPQPPPEPPVMPVAAGNGDGEQGRFWAAVEAGDVAGAAGAVGAGERVRVSLGEVLPVLAAWRRGSRDRAVLEGWRYRVVWEPVADPAPAMLAGWWLVVVPAGGAAEQVAEGCVAALEGHGARVVVLEVGLDLAGLDRSGLAARIRDALAASCADGAGADGAGSGGGVAGVVSLLGLEEHPCAGLPGVAGGLAGTLVLVQALGEAGVGGRWWAVTRGAVAAGPGERAGSVVQAMVWGLGRVAGLEFAGRWGGLVDLPAGLGGRVWERVCGVLAGGGALGGGEDQVVVREAGVMVRRLVRAPVPAGEGGAGGGGGRGVAGGGRGRCW